MRISDWSSDVFSSDLYSGGSTAQDSAVEPGSSWAVRRSEETQKEIVSPFLRSVNFTFLPSIMTPASGAGLKLNVERRSPFTFSSSTVVQIGRAWGRERVCQSG